MRTYLLILLTVVCLLPSCKKRNYVMADSVTVIHQTGAPAIGITYYYRITPNASYQDTTSPPQQSSSLTFDYQLEQHKHDQLVYLLNEIPKKLLDQNGAHFDSKSTHTDCDHVIVKATVGGQDYSWSFNGCTEGMKRYARLFAQKVMVASTELRE